MILIALLTTMLAGADPSAFRASPDDRAGVLLIADDVLRDAQGRLLGRFKTLHDGRIELRDSSGRLKGRYDPKSNQTRDDGGRLVGTGNQLARLLGAAR